MKVPAGVYTPIAAPLPRARRRELVYFDDETCASSRLFGSLALNQAQRDAYAQLTAGEHGRR
jgi:hypothetical protein